MIHKKESGKTFLPLPLPLAKLLEVCKNHNMIKYFFISLMILTALAGC